MARVLGLESLIARIPQMPHFERGTVAGLSMRKWPPFAPRNHYMYENWVVVGLSIQLTVNAMAKIRRICLNSCIWIDLIFLSFPAF
jgi:hypothetical protein